MKSFLVEMETEKVWVFGIYGVILAVMIFGYFWQRMGKIREAKRAGVLEVGGEVAEEE